MTSVSQVLRALTKDLADAAIESYLSIDGAPLPVPSPLIPPMGQIPTIDCGDLLIVGVTSTTQAFQGLAERCALVLQANLNVTVTRCIANLTDFGNVASRSQLTSDGLSLADDESTLWYGITEQCRLGMLWKSFDDLGCESTRFREIRPGASGGIGWLTWQISVDVAAAQIGGNDPIVWQDGAPINWVSLETIDWQV